MKKSPVLLSIFLMLTACVKSTAEPVSPGISTPPPVLPDQCADSAAFVSDVTIPDGSSIPAGSAFTKTWKIRNTGTCTWTVKYSLVFVLGEQMRAPEITPLIAPNPPGNTIDISIDLIAPEKPGAFQADFQLLDPNGNVVPIDDGWYLWTSILVEGAVVETEPVQTLSPPGLVESACAYATEPARAVDLVNAINAYRAQNGLAPFKVNPQLTLAAQSHSEDMACNNLFVHVGSNGSTPQMRVQAAGYLASTLSENVFVRYPAPRGAEAVTWWAADQADPMNNANLLSTQFTEIGAGYAFFDNFGYFAVVFAEP